MKNLLDSVKAALFGLSVGDALGVPVEFVSPQELENFKVTDMISGGVRDLPAGTWSDDSSQAFILTETLAEGFTLERFAERLILWHDEGYWTPDGDVIGIGKQTMWALFRIAGGASPYESGSTLEKDNGNGALMRSLPLVFKFGEDISSNYDLSRLTCLPTHGHIRCSVAVWLYNEYAKLLLNDLAPLEALERLREYFSLSIWKEKALENELENFLFIHEDFWLAPSSSLTADGYVINTLKCALWSFLNSTSYSECVLKAVNLGYDTDTTACVAGGLAGIYYGFEGIPEKWVNILARKEHIEELCEIFANSIIDKTGY